MESIKLVLFNSNQSSISNKNLELNKLTFNEDINAHEASIVMQKQAVGKGEANHIRSNLFRLWPPSYSSLENSALAAFSHGLGEASRTQNYQLRFAVKCVFCKQVQSVYR